MNKTPEIRFSSPQNPESWTPNAASHGGNIIACLTDADAKSAEGVFNELLERIRQYDRVIQAVATALGGVCCGGIDVDGPGGTKDVLVGAIAALKQEITSISNLAFKRLETLNKRTDELYRLRRQLAEKEAALAGCIVVIKKLSQVTVISDVQKILNEFYALADEAHIMIASLPESTKQDAELLTVIKDHYKEWSEIANGKNYKNETRTDANANFHIEHCEFCQAVRAMDK